MRCQLTLDELSSRVSPSCSTYTPLLLLPRHLFKLMQVSDALLHILSTAIHINRSQIVFRIFVMIEIHDVGLVEVLVNVYNIATIRRYISYSM